MRTIPMSPAEFAAIKSELAQADPDEIAVHPVDGSKGNIVGNKGGYNFSADYTYDGKQLAILGHSILFARRIEDGMAAELQKALDAIRNPPPEAA